MLPVSPLPPPPGSILPEAAYELPFIYLLFPGGYNNNYKHNMIVLCKRCKKAYLNLSFKHNEI